MLDIREKVLVFFLTPSLITSSTSLKQVGPKFWKNTINLLKQIT